MKPRKDRRAIRRQEAEERRARWEALSLDEKLAELARRPGNCAKQIARLTN